jgi:hypothetical protein
LQETRSIENLNMEDECRLNSIKLANFGEFRVLVPDVC